MCQIHFLHPPSGGGSEPTCPSHLLLPCPSHLYMGKGGLTAIIIRDEKAKAIHVYPSWNLLSVNLWTVEDLYLEQ